MNLFFVFSAPICGPVTEWGGGFRDLECVKRTSDEAYAECVKLAKYDQALGRRHVWYTPFDTETLETGNDVWVLEPKTGDKRATRYYIARG